MTPAARVQAAIEILDAIGSGDPAERALTRWARSSRYAGSKDRAAVRNHVFDVLRRRRSSAALGGAETGRGLMLGLLRGDGIDPGEVFGATPHAPPPLSEAERATGRDPEPGAEALDLPDWLWSAFQDSLGETAEATAEALRHRAPVHLRVNLARTSVADAQAALARARTGEYTSFEVGRGLPADMLARYFNKGPQNHYIVSDKIRSRVTFKPRNLLEEFDTLGNFDIIFCRNVLIYFDRPTKSDVLNRLARVLAPDGYLILGGPETTLGLCDAFERHGEWRNVYTRIKSIQPSSLSTGRIVA